MLSVCSHILATNNVHNIQLIIFCPVEHNLEKDYACVVVHTSVVTSLMKGKMALTLVEEEANCKHSAKKPCLEGWARRCSLLQTNTRSLQEAADARSKTSSSIILYVILYAERESQV